MQYIDAFNELTIRFLSEIISLIGNIDTEYLRTTYVYQLLSTEIGGGIGLIILIITIIALWRIFRKASEPGWVAIIPIVNFIYLVKISFGSGWYFLLFLIPIVNVVMYILLCWKLSHAFGHGFFFGLGVFLLNTLFLWILGFGRSRYVGIYRRN